MENQTLQVGKEDETSVHARIIKLNSKIEDLDDAISQLNEMLQPVLLQEDKKKPQPTAGPPEGQCPLSLRINESEYIIIGLTENVRKIIGELQV